MSRRVSGDFIVQLKPATCTASAQQRADWKSLLDSGAKSKGDKAMDKANLVRDQPDQLTEMISGKGGEFTLDFDDDEAGAAEFASNSKAYSVRARNTLSVVTEPPSPRRFGKAFSSDITGDGPSTLQLYNLCTLPLAPTPPEHAGRSITERARAEWYDLISPGALSTDPARQFDLEAARLNTFALVRRKFHLEI